MGIDYSTYVGPFFKCTPTEGAIQYKIIGCPNKNCKTYGNITYGATPMFCMRCGTAITEYVIEATKNLQSAHQIASDDLQDELAVVQFTDGPYAKCHIFVPNAMRNASRKFYVDNKQETHGVEFAEDVVVVEKQWLLTNYTKEHDYLVSKYGELEVHWGVLCYMS